MDVNDNAPQFENGPYILNISEVIIFLNADLLYIFIWKNLYYLYFSRWLLLELESFKVSKQGIKTSRDPIQLFNILFYPGQIQ